ncbi:armadillo-type protein [Baffinella frigidus]|nr:armadillo-type protein [Cryptophyta sp. CCMP2293]
MSLAETFPALLSQNNEARQSAEAHLQTLSAAPSTFLPGLVEVAKTHEQQQFRQMAVVLLRRNLNQGAWGATSADAQNTVKSGLLEGLSAEPVALVRSAFSDAISKLAAVIAAGGAWNEVLPFVFKLCVSEDSAYKQTGLDLLRVLAEETGLDLLRALAEEVGESLAVPALEPMLPLLAQTLAAPTPVAVRVASLKAVASLVPHVQGKEHKALLTAAQGLLPAVFQIIQDALAASASEHMRSCLLALIDLSVECGAFFRAQVDTLVQACLAVSSAESMDEQVPHHTELLSKELSAETPRQIDTLVVACLAVSSAESMDEQVRALALELLVSFTESKPALARKVLNLTERTVPVMLSMAAEVEDEDEWHKNVGDEEDKDEDAETVDEDAETVETGVEAMERFLLAIGGNRAVPATLPILAVPATLPILAARVSSPQWQQRYAALRGLATLVSTADKALREHIPTLVASAVRLVADDHPFVAWAATSVLAALCTCFSPDVQADHHAEIMPALLALLSANSHPRLRARAAKCLVDFTTECTEDEADMLAVYADDLVTSLTTILVSGAPPQQQAAVVAVSALASALDERFLKYYAALIPGLVQLLQGAASSGTAAGRVLAGHTMECISCIADAVGTEPFAADAPRVMDLLMALHQQQLSGDDSQMGTILKASARIAKCMKGAFVPFLDLLLPSVMAYATLDPKLNMEAADGTENGDGEDAEYSIVNMKGVGKMRVSINIKGVGKMRVSINIKELQDKALGCSMLAEWAEALQEHFLPHVEASSRILVPCVTYKLSEDVRAAAVEAIPELLRSIKAGIATGAATPQACSSRETCAILAGGMLHEFWNAAWMELAKASMLHGLWNAAWMELAKASVVEPDPDAQRSILESISACIEVCGDGCLDAAQQEQLIVGMLRPLLEEQLIVGMLRPLLEDHATGAAKEEDEDEEDEEESVMMAVVELLCAALKTHGSP